MASFPLRPALRKQLEDPVARYACAVVVVAAAFGLRKLLEPLTGTDAVFLLFLPAVLVTSVVAGRGPGILATLLSALLGARSFVVLVGHPPSEAAFQALLFVIDCMVVIYLSLLIERSEGRMRDLIELGPDAFFLADFTGRYVEVNQAACRMLGYSREELVGKRIMDLIHPEDESRLAAEKAAMSPPGRALTSEWTLRRNDGIFVPVEVSANILADGRWQAFVRDITARKRLEKEERFLSEAGAVLHSSLDYEQTLVNVGQLVVRDLADWCIVDLVEREGQLIWFKVVSADPSKAALAAQLEKIPIDRSRPYLARPAIESKRPFVIERMTTRGLESFGQNTEYLRLLRAVDPKSVMGLPLVARGQLLGAIVLISSTPSRLYRDDDIQLGEALAERAALAIENGNLYRAAMQATQLRDDVLRVVAHDLRNPLSIILLQSSTLRSRAPERERRDDKPTEAIHRAAVRMNRLIQDLLDVTLLEARQLALKRARLSPHRLLLEVVEAQRALAASASLDVRIDVDGELPDIDGDEHRLYQVFENLIGNAIQFTPAGGRITVAATPGERDVVFRVTDTGSGISPSGVPHVFDRFWQAKKDARQGAGLGLPIARGIVEAHGGRIWVESSLGRGTSFFFTIPRADDGRDKGK